MFIFCAGALPRRGLPKMSFPFFHLADFGHITVDGYLGRDPAMHSRYALGRPSVERLLTYYRLG